ncbi:MAG: biosynthetic arginine decarboxylase, partial [Methanotrichaceae archaeon]|nr:biosynthetic arginine decarboxylase [Methanotrichaceae archaeon]
MWTADDSLELYGIEKWGNGYFSVNDKGNIIILPNKDKSQSVDVMDLIEEIEASKDLEFPVLLRFPQILEDRINEINGAFISAIKEFCYKGRYQPVFPMKVNQRKEVIEYILKYGEKYNIGLEVGTKAELLAALSLGLPKDAPLVCNGYKDEDYLRLALSIHNVNNIIIVVDLFEEIYDILKYAEEMGITPRLGMRLKLFARGSGRWVESGGESAKFGLSTGEALELMRILREKGLADSLKMIHFHIGSQITDIRTIKNAMNEAARIYAKARKMAKIEYLNVGGGLSVDYNGSNTATPSSANYTLQEYANDVVYTVQKICEEEEVPSPTIVSEGGRAIAAYHSMLIFKIIGKKNSKDSLLRPTKEDDPIQIEDLCCAFKEINIDNYKEHYHDALQYRDELYDSFILGNIGLEERAKGETLFWMVCRKAAFYARQAEDESEEFQELKKLVGQKYIGNFSLFQSVPDMWGVEQIFPTIPLHRLKEMPCENGRIVDLTCDSDGEIKRYAGDSEGREYLELHTLMEDEDYYVGVFLLGAYQDTLGDFHNLLGSAHEVHVKVEGNNWWICQKVEGDTCRKLLDFFNYETKDYIWEIMDRCVEKKQCIDKKELEQIEAQLNRTLKGYTYFIDKPNGHT